MSKCERCGNDLTECFAIYAWSEFEEYGKRKGTNSAELVICKNCHQSIKNFLGTPSKTRRSRRATNPRIRG